MNLSRFVMRLARNPGTEFAGGDDHRGYSLTAPLTPDGRLDEAYEIARASDLRRQRSGQDLIGRLARALLKRGREHLDADRPLVAAHDCEKAEQLAGDLPDVAELRAEVATALNAGHDAQQRCAQMLAAARRQFERGQLTLGQQILARNQQRNGEAVILADMAENQRAVIEAVVARAHEALKRDDWQAAPRDRHRPSDGCGSRHALAAPALSLRRRGVGRRVPHRHDRRADQEPPSQHRLRDLLLGGRTGEGRALSL